MKKFKAFKKRLVPIMLTMSYAMASCSLFVSVAPDDYREPAEAWEDEMSSARGAFFGSSNPLTEGLETVYVEDDRLIHKEQEYMSPEEAKEQAGQAAAEDNAGFQNIETEEEPAGDEADGSEPDNPDEIAESEESVAAPFLFSAAEAPLANHSGPFIIGDEREFYSSYYTSAGNRLSIKARLVSQGGHTNIWVLDDEDFHVKTGTVHDGYCRLNDPSMQTVADNLSAEFDGIYEAMTEDFAPHENIVNYGVGDLGYDGKVNFLLYDIQNDGGYASSYIGGFFYSADFFGTNSMDMLHIDIGHYQGWNDIAPDASESRKLSFYGTLAHEFQHMLFYMSLEHDGSEYTWLNEALSGLAEAYYVRPGTEIISSSRAQAAVRNGYSGGSGYGDFLNFNNSFKNYGMARLFSHLMYNRFSPGYPVGLFEHFVNNSNAYEAMRDYAGNSLYNATGGIIGNGGDDTLRTLYFLFMECFLADGGAIGGDGSLNTKIYNSDEPAHKLWNFRSGVSYPTISSGGTISLSGYGAGTGRATYETLYRIAGSGGALSTLLNITIPDDGNDSARYYVAVLNDTGGADIYPLAEGTPHLIETGGKASYLFAASYYQDVSVTVNFSWTDDPPFKVTYDGAGHTAGEVPEDATLYEKGAAVAVSGAGTLEKDGHEFAGWNTALNGTGDQYNPGGSFEIYSDVTLYAQWNNLNAGFISPGLNIIWNRSYGTNGNDNAQAVIESGGEYVAVGTLNAAGGNRDATGGAATDGGRNADAWAITIDTETGDLNTNKVYNTPGMYDIFNAVAANPYGGYIAGGRMGGSALTGTWLISSAGMNTGKIQGYNVNDIVMAEDPADGYFVIAPQFEFSPEGNTAVTVLKMNYSSPYVKWTKQISHSPTALDKSVDIGILALSSEGNPVYINEFINRIVMLDKISGGIVKEWSVDNIVAAAGGVKFNKLLHMEGDSYLVCGNGVAAKIKLDANETEVTPAYDILTFPGQSPRRIKEQNGQIILVGSSGSGAMSDGWIGLLVDTGESLKFGKQYTFGGNGADTANDFIFTSDGYWLAAGYTSSRGENGPIASNGNFKTGTDNDFWLIKMEPFEFPIVYENLKGALNDVRNPPQYDAQTGVSEFYPPEDLPGYEFSGWYDAETGGNPVTEIPAGESGVKILWARWKPLEFSITYENLLAGNSSLNPAGYAHGDRIDAFYDPEVPAGYNFLGWFDADGNPAVITEEDFGDKVFYAAWNPPLDIYGIAYHDLFGVKNHPENPFEYIPEIGIKDGGIHPPAARENYGFLGWYEEKQPDSTQLSEAPVPITGIGPNKKNDDPYNLYAWWNPDKYKIFYENLGDAENHEDNPSEYVFGTGIPEGGFKDPGARQNYGFDGWYDKPQGSEGAAEITEIPADAAGDKTLYAWWNSDKYKIFYENLGGAENHEDNPTEYVFGTGIPEGGFKDPGARQGYAFMGWRNKPQGSEDADEITEIPADATGDTTLYAWWMTADFIITYNNASRSEHDNPAGYSYGTGVASFTPASRIGHVFIGWYDAETGGNKITGIPAGAAGDKELWAVWERETYIITYNDLRGAANSNPTVYTYGASFVFSAPGELTGYIFEGWTDSDGNAVTGIAPTDRGHKEIWAVWRAENPKIKSWSPPIHKVDSNAGLDSNGDILNSETSHENSSFALTIAAFLALFAAALALTLYKKTRLFSAIKSKNNKKRNANESGWINIYLENSSALNDILKNKNHN